MCCFVILLLSNEMQMSVRRFSAIPHLRAKIRKVHSTHHCLGHSPTVLSSKRILGTESPRYKLPKKQHV